MQGVEAEAKCRVAATRRVVKRTAWPSVVTEVTEQPGLGVEAVRPVGLRTRRVQHGDSIRVNRAAAVYPESTLVADREQPGKWVVTRIATGAAHVGGTHNEIGPC